MTRLRLTSLMLLCVSCFSVPAHAQSISRDSGLRHEFWMYYMAVQYSLKSNNGELNYVAALDRMNPTATRFLAKFWWKKINRECLGDGVQANRTVMNIATKDEVDIMQNVDEEMKYCAYNVIYNEWDDINETIQNRYKTEQTDTRRALQASLSALGMAHRGY